MRYTYLCLVALACAIPAAAQTSEQPFVVEVAVDEGAAITGINTQTLQPSAVGVFGEGHTGVRGRGLQYGGLFDGTIAGTGVYAAGSNAGIVTWCGASSHCVGLSATARGPYSVGVYGTGNVAVRGVATDQTFGDPPLAGQFIGNVQITGTLAAPIIEQLTARIAALTARIEFLETGIRQLPARIEAEDYDRGGPGIGYNDSTPGNEGGAYRTDDVDIKVSSEGGYAVGWQTAGEWLAYTVNVPTGGLYRIVGRLGSKLPGRRVRFETSGGSLTAIVPEQADWDQYATVDLGQLRLEPGRQVLRVVVEGEDHVDFNYFEVGL